MVFHEMALPGAYLINLDPHEDHRGFFARFFCADEFARRGLNPRVAQINNSFSRVAGTLRGLHYQLPPRAETKVVRCIAGALFDVIVDLRPQSPTFGQSSVAQLSADNRTMLYVPEGVAHGFLTMRDDTEALYLVSEPYAPEAERGIRWNDPRFGISWPARPTVISDKDNQLPDFDPAWHLPPRA
jgi:dTDP-4-dehydrorhamnose 3,5-epimerase